jgi:hypothetical protein
VLSIPFCATELADPPDEVLTSQLGGLQKRLGEVFHRTRLVQLYLGASSGEEQARLLSQSQRGAGAAFYALPSEPLLTLPDAALAWHISHHLGCPDLLEVEAETAEQCKLKRRCKIACSGEGRHVEARAQHAFNCNQGGGTHHRHDTLVRALARCVRQAGLMVKVEPRAQYEGLGNGGPDLLLYEFPLAGSRRENVFVDVAVVNPAQKALVEGARKHYLKAATDREAFKNSLYSSLEEQKRGRVVGAAMEVPGALGNGFRGILRSAAKVADAAEIPLPSSVTWAAGNFGSYWRQQLAVAAIKSSFEMRSCLQGVHVSSTWVQGRHKKSVRGMARS